MSALTTKENIEIGQAEFKNRQIIHQSHQNLNRSKNLISSSSLEPNRFNSIRAENRGLRLDASAQQLETKINKQPFFIVSADTENNISK